MKTHIYCMPGLAASPAIFDNLTLDKDLYEIHYLKWLPPLALEESLANYAMRMTQEIKHKNVVLLGVSFGGIIVQEMSKYIETKKVIIVSSVKSHEEYPKRFALASATGLYKLFPTSLVANFEDYKKFFLGSHLKKRAKLYEKYLSERSETYLKWSIYNVLHWEQNNKQDNVIHIHGSDDKVFPIKYIENAITVNKGTHIMIVTKGKKISEIIHKSLTA